MPAFNDEQLYKVLKELGIFDENQLDDALSTGKKNKKRIDEVLLERDLITDNQLGKIVADYLKLPFVELSKVSIEKNVLNIIPEVVAKKQFILAFKLDKEGLHLAVNESGDVQIVDFVQKKVGVPTKVYYATKRDIQGALMLYTKDVTSAFEDIIAENIKRAKDKKQAEPPIIKIVDTIISYAYQNKASDIHLEPMDKHSLTRFRIDGVLHDIVELPLELHTQIVTRIKVLANLRTDEHHAAQDGKIVYKTEPSGDGEELDIRVSVVPVTGGEKVVMRMLSERSRQFSLVDLGMSDESLKRAKLAYKKPHGMILATGPTGCGKTTTLYAILKLLNKRGVNIMTIEDPVEYDIEGVNQIQTNLKTELTFARGLRSIVRQDPDIILVGEIRDEETADIAVNAALTGHLVLSTLHTNDAATAIPRLLDMGIEPFLVASTVNIIIAQRLVRKIHYNCRVGEDMKNAELVELLGKEAVKKYFKGGKEQRIYHGKGCKLDNNTGYEGRVGIFEALIVDDQVREAIVDRKDSKVISELAVKNGMTTMFDDGIEKVKQGITTTEEVIRVTRD